MNPHRTVIAAVATVLFGCGEPVLVEDGFDLWCGNAPCGWEAKGEMARVGTWHAQDYGVALTGNPASLSQAFPDAHGFNCLRTKILSNLEGGARLRVALYLFADNTEDFAIRIPDRNWELYDFGVHVPDWYSDQVGTGEGWIEIRKSGDGQATLANVLVMATSETCDGPVLAPVDRPLGARCNLDEECTSGVCDQEDNFTEAPHGVCSECSFDRPCKDGSLCESAGAYQSCTPQKTAAECTHDRCLVCATNEDCQAGYACGRGTCMPFDL